jgi:hypothetical protein
MTPRRVKAHPEVKSCRGRVALMRGPEVYCLEGADNATSRFGVIGPVGAARSIVLPPDAEITARRIRISPIGDHMILEAPARLVRRGDPERYPRNLRAIPYRLWANRLPDRPWAEMQPGQMVVWIPETDDLAEYPGEGPVTIHDGVLIRVSHCWPHDTVTALNDGKTGKTSDDHALLRMTWWPRRGTTEWVEYEFREPRTFTTAAVYWFDDTGRGACRVPRSWRLLRHDGTTWKPVELTQKTAYGTARDRWNEVKFEPVKTTRIRLEASLQKDRSAGILEWRVDG